LKFMTTELSSLSDSEKLMQRNRELAILNEIAQALNRSVEMEQALNTVLSEAAELLNLQTGWVWLIREESDESYLAAALNLPPGLARNPQLMEGSCYCLDTYQAGDLEGAANVNVVTCSRLKKLVDGADGLRYHASIPLYAHGKQLGVLNVASRDWRELSSDDLRLLYTIGDLLSIAIERARLYERSAEMGAIEERNRLAREIHDTLAQGLAAIAMQIETAEALLEGGANPARASQALHKALLLARENMAEARRSVMDLRAGLLEGRSLAQALAHLAESYTREGRLQVEFRLSGEQRTLPARLEVGLFRIAQEALSNVEKHAGVDSCMVELSSGPDQVRLTVRDRGAGFDPQTVSSARFGLRGIAERVRLLEGELHIDSRPGGGTTIEVVAPRLANERG
jgi:two-component system, NarL family, sensor kinase